MKWQVARESWDDGHMPDRSRKRPRDLNALAASIVRESTNERDPDIDLEEQDSVAVESGRQGGLKGGRARAEKLTSSQRSEIARKAALARWGDRRRG